ncbi:MAG: energy transducer TonB [Magnetococcales bacterium]|nr:energy transducer TonB [Magnetococcales bacterium]
MPDGPATYRENPKPSYPVLARRRGYQGVVLARVAVDVLGQPVRVEIRQGSGHEILDRAALETLQRWRFHPARRQGQPVASVLEIPLHFKLNDTEN